MLLISLVCLLFSILLRCWRANETIKSTKKYAGKILSIIGMILVSLFFIICIGEEIIFTVSCYEADYLCDKYDYIYRYYYDYTYYEKYNNDIPEYCKGANYYLEGIVVSSGVQAFAYITFSILEIEIIFKLIIFIILCGRISSELDGPPPEQIPPMLAIMYKSNGKNVNVIQQTDKAITPNDQYQNINQIIHNQLFTKNNELENPTSNDFQIKEKLYNKK